MKPITAIGLGVALLALGACGPVHTNHQPYAQVGTTLIVEVSVPDEHAASTTGQVHYQLPASPGYITLPLQHRGNILWQTLPTADLTPGQEARYYFDVTSNDKVHGLAAPGQPYTTAFVLREDVIYHALRPRVTCGKADQPIRFELHTGDHRPTQVLLHIERPDERGHRTIPLSGRNRFTHTLREDRVEPGRWRYWFTAIIEDTAYQVPAQGPNEFLVRDVND